MASLESKKFRRTWPQRTLIVFSLSFVAALIFVSARLNKFDDAVGSIVRIEVPSGVLADIPTEDFEIQEDSNTPLTATNPMFSRNFLIIGTDSAVGLDPSDPASHRDHPEGYALADVIMLVRVDPVNNMINMMSIPRDLYIPIYSQGDYIREEKIASAMLVGGLEKGAPTLVETISVNFDVPIHNFVVMDFLGFEQLIDLIGGVSMWFEHPIRDLSSKLSVNNSGCSEFDGRTSLAYVRSRKLEALVDGWWRRGGVSNDMERNQRQQEFMIRVLEELVAQGISSLLTDDELLEIAIAEAEGGHEGPQTKQDLEVIAILSAVNTAVTVMVLGFLYIIGRSRSGATLALKMMYPIETWNSTEPTADFIRLLAVCLAAGIMAMPIMKIVGKGMLRLHAAIPLQSMVMGVIIFVAALVWLSTGFVGIGVLIVGTILGMMPPRIGIRRSHGMGIILVPIMIYTFAQMADNFGFI